MTAPDPANPLIVQSDRSVLVEADNPRYPDARDGLARFAELIKSPEHIHTYRITPLSIWNARSAGIEADEIVDFLLRFAKYPIPEHVLVEIRDAASRYGSLRLIKGERGLILDTLGDAPLAEEISRHRQVAPWLGARKGTAFHVDPDARGRLKQALVKIGFPVEDLAGYTAGEELPLQLRETTQAGRRFSLRAYQTDAADAFHAAGGPRGGSGVIVLPCGGGKTILGIAAMARLGTSTLVLATNTTSVRQWIEEILDKTTLDPDQIGEYSGARKDIRPVTVCTYQILTHRASKNEEFTHLGLFDERDWGLIIYDEVHLLPAPVFQITAGLQARRRLGLTATLVREDGREDDVFALIGPKKSDVPWKELEAQGWIAKARCAEIRVPLPQDLRMPYAIADRRAKFRIASENPEKHAVLRRLIDKHAGERILVIGAYVDQLKSVAEALQSPLLTGTSSQKKRDQIFGDFKAGHIPVLVVSKIANFSIDLPDASVAIQISGQFGSRQEEAQRLGRILRPKPGSNQAHFYTLVSRDTREQEFALNRQLFLCEQGYGYHIEYEGE